MVQLTDFDLKLGCRHDDIVVISIVVIIIKCQHSSQIVLLLQVSNFKIIAGRVSTSLVCERGRAVVVVTDTWLSYVT